MTSNEGSSGSQSDAATPQESHVVGVEEDDDALLSAALQMSKNDAMAAKPQGKLICSDCNTGFQTKRQAEEHASSTGHVNFEENEAVVGISKQFTPEEKEAQRQMLLQRIQERKQQRAEEEKKSDLTREIQRRVDGKAVAEQKARMEEAQRKRDLEKKRREEIAVKEEREKIRRQIEEDKQRRKQEREQTLPAQPVGLVQASSLKPALASAQAADIGPDSMCELKIRLPTGETITESFRAGASVGAHIFLVTSAAA